jgi:hypothetical protein
MNTITFVVLVPAGGGSTTTVCSKYDIMIVVYSIMVT